MKKFLVMIAYVDRGADEAALLRFVLEAPTAADAHRVVHARLRDRAWCAAHLFGTDEVHLDGVPLFDDGVDAAHVEIVALEGLASEQPVVVGGSWPDVNETETIITRGAFMS